MRKIFEFVKDYGIVFIVGAVLLGVLALLATAISDTVIESRLNDQYEMKLGDKFVKTGTPVVWSNDRGTLFHGKLLKVKSNFFTPVYGIKTEGRTIWVTTPPTPVLSKHDGWPKLY